MHTAAVAGKTEGCPSDPVNVIHCNLQMMIENHFGPDDCHICFLPLFMAALSMTMTGLFAGGFLGYWGREEASETTGTTQETSVVLMKMVTCGMLKRKRRRS